MSEVIFFHAKPMWTLLCKYVYFNYSNYIYISWIGIIIFVKIMFCLVMFFVFYHVLFFCIYQAIQIFKSICVKVSTLILHEIIWLPTNEWFRSTERVSSPSVDLNHSFVGSHILSCKNNVDTVTQICIFELFKSHIYFFNPNDYFC